MFQQFVVQIQSSCEATGITLPNPRMTSHTHTHTHTHSRARGGQVLCLHQGALLDEQQAHGDDEPLEVVVVLPPVLQGDVLHHIQSAVLVAAAADRRTRQR